jgi:hypothetical protein
MRFWRLSLVLITTGALALPAPAGILFGKKTKPNATERVPELIVIVKTDKDESKRAAAAEELRQYDLASHPDIVPVLIDVLMNDPKPAVRVEAAESLGKIRPVSQEAGWALEQAREKDASMRVRTKARYELLGYYWAGYHSDPKMKDAANPPDPGKGAPPAGANKGTPEKIVITPVPQKTTITPTSRPVNGETVAPPLADPATKPDPKPAPSLAPRPLPQGPARPPVPAAQVMPFPPPPVPAPAKVEPSPLPPLPPPPADGGPPLNGPGA